MTIFSLICKTDIKLIIKRKVVKISILIFSKYKKSYVIEDLLNIYVLTICYSFLKTKLYICITIIKNQNIWAIIAFNFI